MEYRHLSDIEDTTLYEYEMKMTAYNLSRVDKQMDMHTQAWINHQATAMKEKGNKQVSVYKDFKDFFDYEKQLKEMEKPKKKTLSKKMKRLARIAARLNKEGG